MPPFLVALWAYVVSQPIASLAAAGVIVNALAPHLPPRVKRFLLALLPDILGAVRAFAGSATAAPPSGPWTSAAAKEIAAEIARLQAVEIDEPVSAPKLAAKLVPPLAVFALFAVAVSLYSTGCGPQTPAQTAADVAIANGIEQIACKAGETAVALAEPDGGTAVTGVDTACGIATSPIGQAALDGLVSAASTGAVRLRRGPRVQAMPAPLPHLAPGPLPAQTPPAATATPSVTPAPIMAPTLPKGRAAPAKGKDGGT
jgi:hypothetical protein